jgi:hypothetical protein
MPRYRASSSSSSPPSSPSLCVDSSPASSPPLEPMDLDDSSESPPPMHLSHPFAASVKATRAPPQRDLGRLSSQKTSAQRALRCSRLEPPTKKFRSDRDDYIDLRWEDDMLSPSYAYQDPEMAIWDSALTKVVDSGHGAVTLRCSKTQSHFERTTLTSAVSVIRTSPTSPNESLSSVILLLYRKHPSNSMLVAWRLLHQSLAVVCSPESLRHLLGHPMPFLYGRLFQIARNPSQRPL